MTSRTPTEEPTETTVEGHFNGNDGGNGIGIITDTNNYEQTLLWIHQSKWQLELLARYGNTISLIIDNRRGRRDWKRLYVYTADARHGHVTLSKVRESHNFATPQRLHLLPSRECLCIVAESPEVLKSKEERIRHLL